MWISEISVVQLMCGSTVTVGFFATADHRVNREVCTGIGSDIETGFNFAAVEEVDRGRFTSLVAGLVSPGEVNRIREPVLPAEDLAGTGNVPVATHGHDREFREIVHVTGQVDGNIDIVVPAHGVGEAHTEEDDTEPGRS